MIAPLYRKRITFVLLLSAVVAAPGLRAAEEAGAGGGDPEQVEMLLDQARDVLEGVEKVKPAVVETPPSGEVLELDIRQSVERALRENAQALIALEDMEARRAQVRQAKSARLPQLKGQITFTYDVEEPESFNFGDTEESLESITEILGGFLTDNQVRAAEKELEETLERYEAEINGLQPEQERTTIIFSLEQAVFAGGQIHSAIKAAKYLAESEAWKREVTLDQLEYETRQAFQDCRLAEALVEVATDSVDTFKRHTEDTAYMLEVGLVSRFEVLRAETELGARQSDLVAAQSALRLAKLNLKRILAMAPDRPIQLKGGLDWTPVETPLPALIDEALSKRPELFALDMGIEAAKKNVRMRQGQYLPKAGVTAQWQSLDGTTSIMPDGLTLGVGAEWDFYTGGRRRAEVAEAKAKVRSLEYQRTDLVRLIEMDVRQAWIRVDEAIAKIRKEKGTVKLAGEGARLAGVRYQEGVGTQVETMDADLAHTQARTALAKAVRDYEVAMASLEKALGRHLVPRESPAAQ